MLSITKILVEGAILSLFGSLILITAVYLNPRFALRDLPRDIQNKVPPLTGKEKLQALVIAIPFFILVVAVPFVSTLTLKYQNEGNISFILLFVNAFAVLFLFNLVDLLLLDWLMYCTITPRFVVIPGTEVWVDTRTTSITFERISKERFILWQLR